jgi:hypothetical protein
MEQEPDPVAIELARRAEQERQIGLLAEQLRLLPEGVLRQAMEAEIARLEQIVSARKNREFVAGMAQARPRD